MADIGHTLRSYLLTKTAITDIVGQRIYADLPKKDPTTPFVVYWVISSTRDHQIANKTKLVHARIEIDCVASTRATSAEISQAIKDCGICAYRGTVNDIFINGVEIDSDDQYLSDPATDGTSFGRFITTFDLLVHYTEA